MEVTCNKAGNGSPVLLGGASRARTIRWRGSVSRTWGFVVETVADARHDADS